MPDADDTANVPDPPPIVTRALLVPVAMLTALLELTFKLIVPPDMVSPSVAVSNAEKVVAPVNVFAVDPDWVYPPDVVTLP